MTGRQQARSCLMLQRERQYVSAGPQADCCAGDAATLQAVLAAAPTTAAARDRQGHTADHLLQLRRGPVRLSWEPAQLLSGCVAECERSEVRVSTASWPAPDLNECPTAQTHGSKTDWLIDRCGVQGPAAAGARGTLIMAPQECHRHAVCPEPQTRTSDPPPENNGRLTVLTAPGAPLVEQ